MLTEEQWDQVQDLFDRGLNATAHAREDLLVDVESELANAVRELWRQHNEAGSFLNEPLISADRRFAFQDGESVANRFTILKFIGSGGMGEVYQALDNRLGRVVALKVLNSQMLARPELKNQLQREARAICSLNHPRICSLHDLCWQEDMPVLVMEYLSGQTLADRLASGRLPIDELLTIADEITDALAYAHDHGVIHRDLKPSNIFLTPFGAKLLDFGIAKRAITDGGDTETVTCDNVLVGSSAFMSPEQAEGKNIDQRSDIFSFGAVLYEMATGERAFRGDSLISTLAAVLTIEPTPVQTIIPAWPAALDRVLQKCLRKKPEQRYANIAEVRQSLKHLQPERRRTKSIAVAAIGLTALVLTLAAVSGLRRETRAQLGAPLPRPTQITRDLGVNADPSLSPDERWIAYVSDREVAGKFGIWLHNLQSGSERQVVGGCDRAADPVFTPDGTKLIYVCQLSGEETATMYEVAIAGGSPKRMVTGASWPSPSPDGKSVAYILNSQDLYISRLLDGSPVRLTSNVRPIYRAVWSPDGKHLMFYGAPSSDLSALNFWVIPTDRQGVAPAKSSLSNVLSMKVRIGPEPQLPILLGWKQSGVYVSRPLGETRDVWRVAVDSNGLHAVSTQVPVTMNVDPRNGSVANQRIVFDRRNQRSNLMSLSLDQQTSRASGPPRPLTSDEASNYYATAPGHGRTIVYTSTRRGNSELFSLDVTTGQRTKLPVPATQYSARITSDGSRIAWTTASSDGKLGVYVSAWPPSVNPVPLCAACGVVLDWLPDKSAVLLTRDPDHEHSLVHLDLNTRTRKAIVTESDRLVTSASVSPDGRWVAFRSEFGNRARVYIAPLSGSNPIPRSQWILAVDDSSRGSHSWSADGGLLYFAAWGAREIVAIPLHSKTKYPLGPAVSVHRLEDPRSYIGIGITATRTSLIYSVVSATSNIWVQDLASM